jgi:hypothetical protein
MTSPTVSFEELPAEPLLLLLLPPPEAVPEDALSQPLRARAMVRVAPAAARALLVRGVIPLS